VPLHQYRCVRNRHETRQSIDQCRMTNELVGWIRHWKPYALVGFVGNRNDPLTSDAEHCSPYIEEKPKGTGRKHQIAQVDIVMEEPSDSTVALLIEIEPDNRPKTLLGDVLSILLADNYTPSHLHGVSNA